VELRKTGTEPTPNPGSCFPDFHILHSEVPHLVKLKLIIVWLMVAIPLGWGVAKSLKKSRPLFSGTVVTVGAELPK
jgi:hypothetical protein